MRVALFVFSFVLCIVGQAVLAADPVYETRTIVRNRNGKNLDNGFQVVRYNIKRPFNKGLQYDSPVFYVVGGRVTVEEIQNQYTFFDKQFNDFGSNDTVTPTVVYVEQRYFGKSDDIGKITVHTDLVDLNLDNVVNDHVELIKELADELLTGNFLVAGGGHGGLIAGYVADRFATDKNLRDYNVLGWASSPPLKYIRQDNSENSGLQDINSQFATLLTTTGECATADIAKFKRFFDGIKAYTATNQAIVNALKLSPTPSVPLAGSTTTSNDLRELAIYVRNKMIGLSFDNNPYILSTGKYQDRKLKKLCDAIKQIDTPVGTALPADKVNAVLAVFDSRPIIDNWKLLKTDNTLEKSLAAAYYQDCTQLRLVFCPAGTTDQNDPFTGSQWDTSLACASLTDYDAVIKAECQGLFGSTLDPSAAAYKNTYPRSFTNKVITTINKQSIFGKSIDRFNNDKEDESKFSTHFELSGVDNWEFQAPQTCDTEHAKDIRYLVLRAFGCSGKFIDNYKGICDKNLFNDDKPDKSGKIQPYDDTPPSNTDCPPDTSDNAVFPFGHDTLNLQNPNSPIPHHSTPSTPKTAKTAKTNAHPTQTTSKPAATTSGSGSIFSTFCILLSSMFVWFTAGAMI